MEKKQLTNWQAIGVGILAGIILLFAMFLFLSLLAIFQGGFLSYLNSFNDTSIIYLLIASIAFSYPGIPFGIIGALIGKSRKNTGKAMWIGGALGAVLGTAWCYAVPLLGLLFHK